MKRYVLALFVLTLLATMAAGAFATTVTVQRGTYGNAIDAYLRQDGMADTNMGDPVDPNGLRVYGDTGYGSKGQRHLLIMFDLSFIPTGSTINSAVFGQYYWYGTGRPDITDLKLSRLQPGTSWVEGRGDKLTTVSPWPTWNQREYGVTNWGAAGAVGAGDIDLGTTKLYNLSGGDGYRTVTVTDFVNGWVNGGWANNGMLLWGGVDPANTGAGYWFEACSESTVSRPYLMIDYTEAPIPEPSSLLALAGFGMAGLGFMRRRKT